MLLHIGSVQPVTQPANRRRFLAEAVVDMMVLRQDRVVDYGTGVIAVDQFGLIHANGLD